MTPKTHTETLPPSLSPLLTDHPASCAYWITASPHEWTWTQAQQEAMARALVMRDAELIEMRDLLARYALGLQQVGAFVGSDRLPTPEARMAKRALTDPTFGDDPKDRE